MSDTTRRLLIQLVSAVMVATVGWWVVNHRFDSNQVVVEPAPVSSGMAKKPGAEP